MQFSIQPQLAWIQASLHFLVPYVPIKRKFQDFQRLTVATFSFYLFKSLGFAGISSSFSLEDFLFHYFLANIESHAHDIFIIWPQDVLPFYHCLCTNILSLRKTPCTFLNSLFLFDKWGFSNLASPSIFCFSYMLFLLFFSEPVWSFLSNYNLYFWCSDFQNLASVFFFFTLMEVLLHLGMWLTLPWINNFNTISFYIVRLIQFDWTHSLTHCWYNLLSPPFPQNPHRLVESTQSSKDNCHSLTN